MGSVFGGLGGPWGLSNHPKMWGAKPPTFLDGFKAPRGRPDPKNRPKKSGQTAFRYPVRAKRRKFGQAAVPTMLGPSPPNS